MLKFVCNYKAFWLKKNLVLYWEKYDSRTEKHIALKLSAHEKEYVTFLLWDGYKTVFICEVQQHYVWIGPLSHSDHHKETFLLDVLLLLWWCCTTMLWYGDCDITNLHCPKSDHIQRQVHVWGSYSNSFKQGNNTEVNDREISFEVLFFFLSFFVFGGGRLWEEAGTKY